VLSRSETAGACGSPRAGCGTRAVIVSGLTALVLAGGNLGPLAGSTARIGAVTALLLSSVGALFPGVPVRRDPPSRLLAFLLIALSAAILVPRAPLPEGPIAAATLTLLATIVAARWAGSPLARSLEAVAAAGLVLTAYVLLISRIPGCWPVLERATRAVTGALGRAAGSGTSLGPSVAGLPVLLVILAYLAARAISVPRGGRPPIFVGMLWVVALAAIGWSLGVPLSLRAFNTGLRLLAVSPTGEMTVPGYPASVAVFLPLGLFLAWLAPVVALVAGPPDQGSVDRPETARSDRPERPGPASFGLAAACALSAVVAALPTVRLPGPERRPRIVFPERGKLVGWEVPVIGSEGLERAGMFGMLPRYLRAAGFETRRTGDALTEQSLASADVAVVINPTEHLTADERSRLERFVRRGGGLVVLGDHTDIFGSQAPLNELLEPYGVAYRFDSAFTPGHWRNDAGFFPGPLTRGLDDANSRFQQSTGASLSLSRGAEPVATARWGFSDAGDRENKDNGFLGDYIYQASETLGDLAVVAMARHGDGRVIVFGDTSAFQNIATPFSWPFILRVFQVAAGRDLRSVRLLVPMGVAAWIALWAAVLARRRLRDSICLAAGTVAGLMVAAFLGGAFEPAPRLAGDHLALVDVAHFNAVSLDLWDPHALSALNVNLARNGYLPVVDREGSGRLLQAAELYVSVAPRKPPTRADLDRLRELADRGGRLILAVGWDDKKPSEPLLRLIGLGVAPVPLGPVPILRKINDPEIFARLQMEPHFAAAWPIEGVAPGRDEILYSSDRYPVVVRRPFGRGTFTLLGDSRFLLNRTLEEEGTSWKGNVAFLRKLFEPEPGAVAVQAR
jgi:uncharacterized protein DUF4350